MLVPTATKYCWAWNRVYVKANGRIPCWCDSGEPHTIIHVPFDQVDFIQDIVNSPQMRKMRTTINLENNNYIKECTTCCCMTDENRGAHFRFADKSNPDQQPQKYSLAAANNMRKVNQQRGWPMGSIDHIHHIQLEPSFPCNLKCPGCLQGILKNPLDTEPGPYIFPYSWFEKMVRSIIHNKVQLDSISFVGRGEPTLNQEYPQMLAHARRMLPHLLMSMDTNANQKFKPEYLHLSYINCSIDGSDQQSYEKYRHGGKLDKAVQFMTEAVLLKKRLSSKCHIRWKYILFNTNDADQQLNRAQQMASEMGIDQLHLVITHTGSYDGKVAPSSRFKTMTQINEYINNNPIFKHTVASRAT